MRIAITGGTGFVGGHLAARLDTPTLSGLERPGAAHPSDERRAEQRGTDEPVIVSRRTGVRIDDVDALTAAFTRCDAIAHCAGINREIGDQTFERVHVRGTEAVIEAARRAGVGRLVMLSFLRARPDCGSRYHESKWAAEELIRRSGLEYTVLKAGMVYGRGDHLVDHVSRSVQTLPLFGTVGFRERPIRPVPVDELVTVLLAALRGELPDATVAVVGGEQLLLSEAVRRIARTVDRRVLILPTPVWSIRMLAQLTEWTMRVPLIAKAQARMLAEGVAQATPPAADLPEGLRPRLPFDAEQIRRALPDRGGFGLRDLRFARAR